MDFCRPHELLLRIRHEAVLKCIDEDLLHHCLIAPNPTLTDYGLCQSLDFHNPSCQLGIASIISVHASCSRCCLCR